MLIRLYTHYPHLVSRSVDYLLKKKVTSIPAQYIKVMQIIDNETCWIQMGFRLCALQYPHWDAAKNTWSETYFRQDPFPSYLLFRRQFHAIVIFRLKSISDLDSGFLPRFFGEFIYAKLKIVVS